LTCDGRETITVWSCAKHLPTVGHNVGQSS